MNRRMKLSAIAAISTLTVAGAVPALALENEFHGMFRLRGIASNFDDGGGGSQFSGDATKPGSLNKKHPGSSAFIDQRARIMYTAKVDDELKLITHFEIDSRWGDNSYNSNGTTRNGGAAIGADQVNLETKNVFVDYSPTSTINTKLGLQFWNLGYKGIVLNDDQAGLVVNAKLGAGSLGFAYFRLDDATGTGGSYIANGTGTATTTATGATSVVNPTPGNRTRDFLTLGGKYSITKDFKVGADTFSSTATSCATARGARTSI